MQKNRLEAFSDGVLAIIITIMVLELKVPEGAAPEQLLPLIPSLLSYVLSFLYVAIYWNNHHHLLHTCGKVTGRILWANMHLLFWLSLLPVATGWMGGNHFAAFPTVFYGVILLACATAYYLLQGAIIATHGEHSVLKRAIGSDRKGKSSLLLYLAGIALCRLHPGAGQAVYALVAMMWLIPDRRIERALASES